MGLGEMVEEEREGVRMRESRTEAGRWKSKSKVSKRECAVVQMSDSV